MGQGSSAAHGEKGARASVPHPPEVSDITNTQPRSRPFPIDINQSTAPRHPESPVFFGSPLNSPIDSQFHSDRGRQTLQTQPTARGDKVPTVFRWTHGGNNVYITGTFNNWKERIPLNRSHEEFATIIDLPEGVHQYKFIVDDEWRYNPDLPTMPDRSGAINNFLEVTNQEDALDFEDFAISQQNLSASPPGQYAQDIPTLDSGTKPPPVLPPHLMQVLLNCEPVSEEDPTLLPIPNHVMLNHLYALSISDGVMVMGATSRYNQKYVTTILYRPVFDE